jgi:aspartate racemase
VHIGIVSNSAEGACMCIRTICTEGPKLSGASHNHPEVSLHIIPLAHYMRHLDKGEHAHIADLMLESANKLASIGAQMLISPDSSVHAAMPLVLPKSPLPWLSVSEVVAEAALIAGYKKLGLLGTNWVIDSGVYQTTLAAYRMECLVPPASATEAIDDIMVSEMFQGVHKIESFRFLQAAAQELKKQGCEAIILGTSEMSLMLTTENLGIPVLSPAKLLAQEALRCVANV